MIKKTTGKILGKLLGSPYPPEETVNWFKHLHRASMVNHTGMEPGPLSKKLREPAGQCITILFFGDLMYMHGDAVPEPDPAIKKIFASADCIIGNCEAPVTHRLKNQKAKYLFTFKLPEEYLTDFFSLYQADPERIIFNVANNHMGDQGCEGFHSTVTRLQNLGCTVTGIHREGKIISTVDIQGITIGILSWTRWCNKNIFKQGTGIIREEDILQFDLAEIRSREKLDLLVVSPHWDYEFQHFPHVETRQMAHRLSTNSADIIAGHHQHVVQPVERIGSALCCYGTGNLFGEMPSKTAKLVSLFEVTADRQGPVSYRVHLLEQVKKNQKWSLRCIDEKEHEAAWIKNIISKVYR